MKDAALSLVQSRKFWLTVISLASAVAAYLHGSIAAPQLSDIIVASVSVLVLAIAHEDHGAKSATAITTGGPTVVNTPSVIPGPEATKGNGNSHEAA